MRKNNILILTSILLVVMSQSELYAGTISVGSQFTYQGELIDNGSPANGEYDFLIQLYDSEVGGTVVDFNNIGDFTVINGLFSLDLDYGDMPFNGDEMYLQVNVRPGSSTSSYESLNPRQRVNATPYAIQADFVQNGGGSPWEDVAGGINYDQDVFIGNPNTTTSSLLTIDTSGGESPLRAKINGSTKLIVRDNGGVSVGANASAPDNGLMVEGDVRQPLDRHGFAKAGITFVCGNQSTNILDQFNNQNSDAIVVTSNLPEDGRCEISFPFDISDVFISATPIGGGAIVRGVNCTKNSNGTIDIIECNAYNPLTDVRADAVINLFVF